jgi:hypothetical protein
MAEGLEEIGFGRGLGGDRIWLRAWRRSDMAEGLEEIGYGRGLKEIGYG